MKNQDRWITSFSSSYKAMTQEMWTTLQVTWVPSGSPGRALTILMRTVRPVPEGLEETPRCFLGPRLAYYTRAAPLHPHTADTLDNPLSHARDGVQQHLWPRPTRGREQHCHCSPCQLWRPATCLATVLPTAEPRHSPHRCTYKSRQSHK